MIQVNAKNAVFSESHVCNALIKRDSKLKFKLTELHTLNNVASKSQFRQSKLCMNEICEKSEDYRTLRLLQY